MENQENQDCVTWTQALIRGAFGKCPSCGDGRLFERYIKVKTTCHNCNLDFTKISRSDDGPAYITMTIVLCVVVPFMLWYFLAEDVSLVWGVVLSSMACVVLSVGLLKPIKGAFIAAVWKAKPRGLNDQVDFDR